jgi:hypothetical protein
MNGGSCSEGAPGSGTTSCACTPGWEGPACGTRIQYTFEETERWCIDHAVHVRYQNNGQISIAGAEPSGNVHTGRGDCGGVSQGWNDITTITPGDFTNVEIKVSVTGDTCGTTSGCGSTWDLSTGTSVTHAMSNCIFSCGGAQKPHVKVEVRAYSQ